MSRILVLTSYPPSWRELAQITCASHKAYCDRWGYDYLADCSDLHAAVRYPEWGAQPQGLIPIRGFVKLALMLHHLDQERYGARRWDWVVWFDADMLVTNREIPLAQWFPRVPERWDDPTGADVIVPFDANGHNATVIIARNTPLVYDFLWASNNAGRSMFLWHDWAEMEAILRFALAPPYTNLLHHRSVKELCAMPPDAYPIPKRVSEKYSWAEGDFAIHFSAMSVEQRVAMARAYAHRTGLTV